VPAAQGVAAAAPAGAKEPAGAGASVPFTLPPAQTKPAGQRDTGSTRPDWAQKKPGAQGMQLAAAGAPVAFRKVPGGQACGAEARAAQ